MKDGAAQRLRLIQWGGVGSALLFAGILIVDFFMIPDQFRLAVALRLGVYVPVVLAGLYLVARVPMPRAMEWLVGGAGILAGGTSMLLSVLSHSPHTAQHLVVLNVVVVYATLIGRFWPMLVMCLVLALGHAASLIWMGDPLGSLGVATTLLLLSTMVFTLYGNYVLEHSDRQLYLVDAQETGMNDELARANEALARVARTDPLTGLANRRHFDDFLQQAWGHAQAQQAPLALMLIDIDHFKRYNDRYGHQAGDECLRTVANTLGASLRKPGDLVARWGGEEFVVVMNNRAPAVAQAAAERVLDAVRAAAIIHEASTASSVVTVSIGLAVTQAGMPGSLDELVETADQALYAAKASGRNQVAVAPLAEPWRLAREA